MLLFRAVSLVIVRVLQYIKQRRFVRQPRLGVCLCPLQGRSRIKRAEKPRRVGGWGGQPRGDAEEGTGHATTGRLVARGGDKRANTILPLTYVTGSHNNFTQPRGTWQDVERAFPGSSSSVSRKKIYFRGSVDRKRGRAQTLGQKARALYTDSLIAVPSTRGWYLANKIHHSWNVWVYSFYEKGIENKKQ